MGEVYAISLAQTLGVISLVTDDTKQGGPYMSLLQFEGDIMPFTYADVLILRYLIGDSDGEQTVRDFEKINNASQLNWSLKSQINKFIRRFWKEPYKKSDRRWIDALIREYNIKSKTKFTDLRKLL